MDLSKSRILIVNDDGITAPGLKLLQRIARNLSKDVWVFAPETEQSGASHSFTLTGTIRVQKTAARRFSVSGSPTDCVLMAMCEFLADHPPDLVLSGINRGANLAEEVTYSGTVAGAMEAALFGVPAIALSQATLADRTIHWHAAEHHAEAVIRQLVSVDWTRDVFMNVNFPACDAEDVGGVAVVKQGRRSAAYEIVKVPRLRGRDFFLIGESQRGTEMQTGDSDHKAVDRNMIAVTPLHVDLTHRGSLTTIRSLFAKR